MTRRKNWKPRACWGGPWACRVCLALDDGRFGAAAAEPAPTRPEDHRHERADCTDDKQDDPDRVDIETVSGDVDGACQHRAHGDQYKACSHTHVNAPL